MLSMTEIADKNSTLKMYVNFFHLFPAIFRCLGCKHGLFVRIRDEHNGCDSVMDLCTNANSALHNIKLFDLRSC